jgi:hypothetical protein
MGNACLEVIKPTDPDFTKVMDVSRQGSYQKETDAKPHEGPEVREVLVAKGMSKSSIQTPHSSDDDPNHKRPQLALKLPTGGEYPVSVADGLDSMTNLHKIPSLQHMIPGGLSTMTIVPATGMQQTQVTQSYQISSDGLINTGGTDVMGTHGTTMYSYQPQSAITTNGPPVGGKLMNKWYMYAGASDLQLLSAIREEQSAMEQSNANFAALGHSKFASSKNNLP